MNVSPSAPVSAPVAPPPPSLLNSLGLPSDARLETCLEAVEVLQNSRRHLERLTGRSGEAALELLEEWRRRVDQFDELEREASQLRSQIEQREFEDLIQGGLESGQLTEELATEWARSPVVGIEALRGFLKHAPRLAPES